MENKKNTQKRELEEQMAKEIKDIEDNIAYLKKVREEKEKGKRMVSKFTRAVTDIFKTIIEYRYNSMYNLLSYYTLNPPL